jgi:Skp family chaperone for outer membrane proteins
MKSKASLLLLLLFICAHASLSQSRNPNSTDIYPQPNNPMEIIANELVKISKSVEDLNKKLKNFSDTFTSNQGLRLTDKQQKLLIAFEFLNRAEQRLVSLQNLKLNLSEKQTSTRLQLARINDDLLPESIDRYVSLRGTTNAEQLREIRRQALQREKNDLTNLIYEIQRDLNEINAEINETDLFLKNLRRRIFPEIEKEISDL